MVNLCVLVNGGQHLFSLYERWMVILDFYRGRSGVVREMQRFRKGSLFFWSSQN